MHALEDVLFYIRVGGDHGFYTDPITGQTEDICFELNGRFSGQIDPAEWPKEQQDSDLILRTQTMLEVGNDDEPPTKEQRALIDANRQAYNRHGNRMLLKRYDPKSMSPKELLREKAMIERCTSELTKIFKSAREEDEWFKKNLQRWARKWKRHFPEYVTDVSQVAVTQIAALPRSHKEPVNPFWFELIVTDKKKHYPYIPEANRPHEWKRGNSTISRTGFWILKPRHGARQEGHEKMSNLKFSIFNALFMDDNVADEYVIQELLPIDSPHNARPEKRGPGVLRLLWDVAVKADGTLQVVNSSESIGSVIDKEEHAPKKHPQWARFSFKKGVHAVKPTEREIRLASKVQMQALKNIFDKNRELWMPQKETKTASVEEVQAPAKR